MRLERLFAQHPHADITLAGAERGRVSIADTGEAILDRFPEAHAVCLSLRLTASEVRLSLSGSYKITVSPAGGWLLEPKEPSMPVYWLPQLPRQRRYHSGGPILIDEPARIVGFDVGTEELSLAVAANEGEKTEVALWRFSPAASAPVNELRELAAVESQPRFLYGSHCNWTRPADLYLHLAHGRVYERNLAWPRNWRIRDELDAYALYLICAGLQLVTHKVLYRILRAQIVLSVLSQQDVDGGFRHGEWTEAIESHFRFAAGGVHLLAAAYGEMPSKNLGDALDRAAAWLARQTDMLDYGPWLLHDSLEQSGKEMALYPLRWVASRALGKSPTNLLVLNTHVDNTLALMRRDEVQGTSAHRVLVADAQRVTTDVLKLRGGEWLYRILFPLIGLTLLPVELARALPLPVRVVKRLVWAWLRPNWHRIKVRFPRLVMPGGYIERDLALGHFSLQYLPVNIWDLARLNRRRPDPVLASVLKDAVNFARRYRLMDTWREGRGWGSALCFWGEALYLLALDDPDPALRRELAESVLQARLLGLGLAPGLTGASDEAIPRPQQSPCPAPDHPALAVINLGRFGAAELIIVNVVDTDIDLSWAVPPSMELIWLDQEGLPTSPAQRIIGKNWVWARQV